MLICFKSYFADQIGISETKYQIGNLGYPFDSSAYNRSLLITHKNKHNLRISSPFRVHFIEDKYHYLQLPRITFNFQKFAMIYPPSLHVSAITIMTMRLVVINLTNVLENTSFTVTDIFTTSRSVFVDDINPKILLPNETMPINIYFCPYDTAVRAALILIRTSLGLIPYSVSFRVIATYKDIGISTFFHQSAYQIINLSLRIPQIIADTSKLSILYDNNLFDSQKSTVVDRLIQLSPINIYLGGYFTFVHLISPTVSRNIPIFILSTNKWLMPYTPVLLTDTVTSPHGYSEEEIKILNLGKFNFNIVSISLKDAPNNVRIEVVSMPIGCAHFCTTVIGKVVILGTHPGEVDTSLVIVYESADLSKVSQSIEIPIRGYVEYGSFEPNETQIDKMIKYHNLRASQLNDLIDYYKQTQQRYRDKYTNENTGYSEYQDYIDEEMENEEYSDDNTDEYFDDNNANSEIDTNLTKAKKVSHNFVDYHFIHFTNHFKVPVAILCAQTDSEEITVVDFTPSVVMPGQKSKDIKIRFQYWTHIKKIVKYMSESGDDYKFNNLNNDDTENIDEDEKISNDLVYIHEMMKAVLTVETNATNIEIPIRTYNGQITIFDNPDENSFETGITKSLGKVLAGSTTNFTFYIRNPNPVEFFVKDYNATPGINVNGFWRGNMSSPLRNHRMQPFSIEEFSMYVTFGHVKSAKQRNDSISIGSDGSSSVQVKFSWTPILGKFVIHSTLPRNLRFGRFYQSKISVTSTYPVTVKLHEITTSIQNSGENDQESHKSKSKSTSNSDSDRDYTSYEPPIYINYETPFLRPNIMTPCGNFSFIFDSRMLKNTYLSPLFNASIDYIEHRQMWEQYTNGGINYEIPLTLHFYSNMRVRRSLPVTIDFYHFNDIVIEGGTIPSMHPSSFTARYTNTIDCPVEFRMNIPTTSKLSKKSIILQEKEKENMNLITNTENSNNKIKNNKNDNLNEKDVNIDDDDEIELNYNNDENDERNFDSDPDSFSFHSESEVTTIVAQSREEFLFNFIITPHKSGQTFFRIPVTTNATPPFFIHVHAYVESPNVELIDPENDNNTIESLEFKSQDEIRKSTWKKSILLRNSGKLSVSLGKFTTKKIKNNNNNNNNNDLNDDYSYINNFDISSNCPQIIEAGNFCQVDVAVRLIHLRKFYEESILSIKYADYWELTCPLKINMSNKCFAELVKLQHFSTFVLLILVSIQPVFTIVMHYRSSVALKNDVQNRLKNLDGERARLSMSRLSVGTQVIIQKADIGGGVWSPMQTEYKVRLTEEAEQDLEELLNSLC